jgi:hypothetical protein
MAFGELLKELIAAVADRLREVHAVRQFEIQECRLMIRSETLQFKHVRSL